MPDRPPPPRGYALVWPRDLFRGELETILESSRIGNRGRRYNALELLLEEALKGPDPVEGLQGVRAAGPDEEVAARFGARMLKVVDQLPHYEPRLYYRDRNTPRDPSPPAAPDLAQLAQSWASDVIDLVTKGYLDRRAGEFCSDSDNDRAKKIADLISDACGALDPWPPIPALLAADQEQLFTLIEVFHDLVSRPRTRTWHDFDHDYCWYDDFNDGAGQALYRWMVNKQLRRHGFDLELADSGDDVGFLVARVDDPRQELARAAAASADTDGNHDRVQHAITLYRKRNATRDDKRRACRELADVLESQRKTILEQQLPKKDEGDLFNIMNNFAIRHHRDDQQPNYDTLFLDWIFWNFLAAVELSNRLIERAASQNQYQTASS